MLDLFKHCSMFFEAHKPGLLEIPKEMEQKDLPPAVKQVGSDEQKRFSLVETNGNMIIVTKDRVIVAKKPTAPGEKPQILHVQKTPTKRRRSSVSCNENDKPIETIHVSSPVKKKEQQPQHTPVDSTKKRKTQKSPMKSPIKRLFRISSSSNRMKNINE